MFNNLLTALFLLAMCMSAYSQSYPGQETTLNVLQRIGNAIQSGAPGFEKEPIEVRGSPYVFDRWLPGWVTLSDGREVSRDSAFNVYATEVGSIHVLLPNGEVIDINEELIDQVKILEGGITHVFKPYEVSMLTGKGEGHWVVEVLYDNGESTFIKRHTRTLRKADYTGAYSLNQRYHEFISDADYYLRYDNSFSKIRLSKGSIKTVSPDLMKRIDGDITEVSVAEALNQMVRE